MGNTLQADQVPEGVGVTQRNAVHAITAPRSIPRLCYHPQSGLQRPSKTITIESNQHVYGLAGKCTEDVIRLP
jgi:hypothetical protein